MSEAGPQGAPIDRYVVLEYLAEGGMGAIYLGKKLGAGGFEKQVVLKQLLPEFTRQPEFIDLFLREARLSATLDHANIIHTIDLVTAGEEYFIVMEYLDGGDLRSLLKKAKRRQRKFSPQAGIFIGRELLSALAYAHNKTGIDGSPLRLIHRDISPSNILVSGAGEVKLTDFGIAKASTHNSVFYRVKGKMGYMSPEQARSEPLDARSDLYSLAVCLFEVITGERLFVSAGLTTSAEEMYSQPVPLVSRKVPGLPADLDKVMLKALAVDPDARFQTAGEFQEALLRCAHRHGLMLSAPELAEHLEEVCGDPDNWRDPDVLPEGTQAGGGTELYDEEEGTEQLDVASLEDEDDLVSIAAGGHAIGESKKRRERAQTSMTHLGELQGVELTSMINLAESEQAGATPLVDLSDFGGSGDVEPQPPKLDYDDDAETGFVVGHPGGAAAVERPATRSPDPLEESQEISASREIDAEASQAPRRRPWIVIAIILLLGLGTAAAIGLTGPELPGEDGAEGGGSDNPSGD